MQIGSMSASAMSQMHAKIFSKIDANSDGGITLEEMTASASEKTKGRGGSEDSAKIAERFARMDSNSDGSVSEEEGLSVFQSQMSSQTMSGMLQAQEGGQDRPMGPPPPPMEAFAQTSESEDTASTATGTTVDEGTAARLAALTTQWIQSMTRVLADQVQSQTSVSVAA